MVIWSPLNLVSSGDCMRILKSLAVVAVMLAGAPAALAQETASPTKLTTDHYFDLERISDAQISPDGSRIIYTRQQVNRLEDKWDSSLWIVNADGSQNRFLGKGGNARWSPDGKRVLFLQPDGDNRTQVFVRWIDVDGAATQVTRAHRQGRRYRSK